MKVLIETHGCKLNMADSQRLAREFMQAGYGIAVDGDIPDVFVLNSCTVTHVADRKARRSLAAARRRFPHAFIVASGCYPERAGEAVAALDTVDLVVPNRDKPILVAEVGRRVGLSGASATGRVGNGAHTRVGRTRASVKIQEGCDQVCAYCIVPRVRGRERSIPERDIIDQVNALVEGGCSEVVLTGTQLGSYGFDLSGSSLASLVAHVLSDTSVPRLRVSSLQPREVTDELLDLWSGVGFGRLCPHFHLPLQSGSDAVLARMRRRYDSATYLRTVASVRAAAPGCSVTTDIIAGFPGESDADHAETLRVVEAARFAQAHVFPYSARPGTSAAHFNGHVQQGIKAARAAEVREASARHALEFRRAMIGTVRPVLWEGQGRAEGLTDNYVRVRRRGGGQVGEGAPGITMMRLDGMDGKVMLGSPAAQFGPSP